MEHFLSRIGSEGGYYRLNTAQRARRRPSVAGRPVLGVRAEGFCGCGAASGLAGLIYRRRGDMCRGYSQSSLVGAKTATLLLPAHLESRLSGSAERLAPSLLLPSLHIHIYPSIPLPLSCCVSLPPPLPPSSSTVCVAAGAQLKFKISSHFFLSPTHFPSPLSFSLFLTQPPTHLMKGKIVRKKMNARHGTHVEDIIEGIVIPLPLKSRSLSVHRGTLQ